MRVAGFTTTSWVPKSVGTLGFLSHPQLRCAGIIWNSGVPKSLGAPYCRIDPDYVGARYTTKPVGSGLQKLQRAEVNLDRITRTTGAEMKRNSVVPKSPITLWWRIQTELRCNLVIRNSGFRDTGMSVSTWTQVCGSHPLSRNQYSCIWDIINHVFQHSIVTGSVFECRYFLIVCNDFLPLPNHASITYVGIIVDISGVMSFSPDRMYVESK